MQPPRDLTGIGLAHLGPITSNGNTTAQSTSPTMQSLETGSHSDMTSEETPDESGLALDGLDHEHRHSPTTNIFASAAVASAKLRSRSTSFIRLDDGSLSECLISDMSNAVKMLASPSSDSGSQRRGSAIKNTSSNVDGLLSFKRRDIETLRAKYRVEVMQQFMDVEAARAKWKSDQLAKAESIKVYPEYDESVEDADRSWGASNR